MANFTPISGLAGGMMIGAAASLLVLLIGRIAGISGIVGGLLGRAGAETAWRAAFVAGLVGGALLVGAVRGGGISITLQAPLPLLLVAGLLVGFGARLGGGCTSGHGVCGLARGAPRSLAATATFFSVALVTVYVMRHLVGG
jgi:uncharacterized membrane protein YedE/YeeE